MGTSKTIPALRFPKFDGVWDETRLEKITSVFQSGKNITAKDISKDGHYPVYGGNGLRGYTSSFNHDGTFILIGRQGALCGNITLVHGKTFVSEHAIAVQTNNHSDDRWLAQRLEYMNLNRYSESSAQPGLAVNKLIKFKIHIPSLHEQQKIATFLEAVDNRIQQLQKKRDLLELYKRGLMRRIFKQEIRFKDDVGKDYLEWQEKRLGDICKITTGKLDANAMKPHGKYRFYTCAKDYYRIDVYAFDVEALLISGNGANVGYIHYYKGKFNAYQRTYVLFNLSEDYKFIEYSLGQFLHKRISKEKKEGNTPYIVLSTLADMNLHLPSLSEQSKIANFISSIDNKINLVNQQLEKTKQYKKGLLQQMFV